MVGFPYPGSGSLHRRTGQQLVSTRLGLRRQIGRRYSDGGRFTPISGELSKLAKACQGRSFGQRRDAAIIAVLTATGIRAGEPAGIRYDPHDPRRSDVDLWAREITVRGKGGKARVVWIGHEAARALDWCLCVRTRHAQAGRRELWLGMNNRGPMTANGIYQMITRRGRTGSGITSPIPGWTVAAGGT